MYDASKPATASSILLSNSGIFCCDNRVGDEGDEDDGDNTILYY